MLCSFPGMPGRAVLQWLCSRGGELDRALYVLYGMDTAPSNDTYLALLKACNKIAALPQANRVLAHLVRHSVQLTGLLGDYLVVTLANCGAIDDARFVSARLPKLTVFSWTAMISAYVDSGLEQEALRMHQCMLKDGVEPSNYTFVTLFKACGNMLDLELGKRFHADAHKKGFGSDIFVGNTLVSMYGKCGAIVEAEDAFHALSHHDIVSWNAMLSAYVEQGQGEKVLQMYTQMQWESVSPDHLTSVTALQACATLAEKEEARLVDGQPAKVFPLEIGQTLHADACKKGFTLDVFVSSTLVSMYGKYGAIVEAEDVFSAESYHDVVSWNAMLSAYVEHDKGEKALVLYTLMQEEGVSPDWLTFVLALQACSTLAKTEEVCSVKGQLGTVALLEIGQAIHADARKKGFASNVFIGNTLVSMYFMCGAIVEAEEVLGAFSQRTVVSWNIMLSAYVDQGQGEKALQLYMEMQEEAISPDHKTYMIALQACATLGEKKAPLLAKEGCPKAMPLQIGQALHADACRRAFVSDIFVDNTLVSMYGKCGAIVEAEDVFGALLQHTHVSWNAMLSAYAQQGQGEKVLRLYRQMQQEGVSPDQLTFVSALQACATLAEEEEALLVEGRSIKVLPLEIGQALHASVRKQGFASDVFVGNTLVNMYAKCGAILEAEDVFGLLSQRTVVTWNAMVTSYAEHGEEEKSLWLYRQMQEEGVSPDHLTSVIALQACATLAEKEEALLFKGESTKVMLLEVGQALHADTCRKGFTSDVYVGSILVSMYGKCGAIVEAEDVFNALSCCDVVCWNAMLSAYIKQDQGEKAVSLYRHMQNQCVSLDHVTFVHILQACSAIGSLELCKSLHFDIVSAGYDQISSMSPILIHAYGSCASIVDGQTSFDRLSKPDILSWNACIDGHAREGNQVASLHMFEELKHAGIKPNQVTFISILSACSHTGLVVKGLKYFESMGRDFGMTLDSKHYGSVLDLLGRAGDFKRVETMLGKMPIQGNLTIWSCLLGACHIHGNLELAEWV